MSSVERGTRVVMVMDCGVVALFWLGCFVIGGGGGMKTDGALI